MQHCFEHRAGEPLPFVPPTVMIGKSGARCSACLTAVTRSRSHLDGARMHALDMFQPFFEILSIGHPVPHATDVSSVVAGAFRAA